MTEELTELQKKNIEELDARKARQIVKAFWQDAEADDDDVFAGRTWRTIHDPKLLDTYEDNEVQITVRGDGAIFFSSERGEDFVYFYPEQVKYLRKALKALSKSKR